MERLHELGLTVVDLVFIGLIAAFTLKGLVRGLSRELSGLLMLFAALAGSLLLYVPLAEKIMAVSRLEGTAARVTGFTGSLVLLWIGLKLLGMLVALLVQLTFTPTVDRFGGLAAGGAKALMLIGVVLMTVRLSGHDYLRRQLLEESRLGALSNRHLPGIYAELALIFPQLPPPSGGPTPPAAEPEEDPAETADTPPPRPASPRIPMDFDELKEDLRNRNDIVDVIGSYLTLKRAGGTYKALCPFHKEKTPSFNVDPRRQIYHCFGCRRNGDVFSFIMEHDGVDFITSMKILGHRVGIEVEDRLGPPGGRRDGVRKSELYELLGKLAKDYHQQLLRAPEAAAARDYLDKRQLLGSAGAWQIGYAPDRWDSVLAWGERNGYSEKALGLAGMLSESESGNRRYDRFRDRIMFPLYDTTGRVIGFSGRVVHKDASPAKYINSPETPVFRKSKVLYGIHLAQRAILDRRQAILCEGQTDVIRCHLAGFTNAVAALGTAVTEDHGMALKRNADEVVLVLDADSAGEEAAIKAAQVFLRLELDVRVAQLGENEDPDTLLLSQGPEAFRARLEEAESILGFQHRTLSQGRDSSDKVALKRVSRALLDTVRNAPSQILQERMIQEAAGLLDVVEYNLRQEFNDQQTTPRTRREEQAEADPAEQPAGAPPSPEERNLLEILLAHPDQGWLVERYLPLECIEHLACRTVIETVLREKSEQAVHHLPEDRPECRQLAVEALMGARRISAETATPETAVKSLILLFRRKRLERELEELARRAREAPGETGLVEELAQLRYSVHLLKEATSQDGWDRVVAILQAF